MNETTQNSNISPILIQLLKGVLYQERQPDLFRDLMALQGPVREYFTVIGLSIVIDEAEGYAFIRQTQENSDDKEGTKALPRLISKRPLGYPLSLMCVLLRKKLAELDAGGGDTRLILSREQIVDMIYVFMPAQKNEARTVDQINTNIKKAVDLGFLRKLSGDDNLYEVRRIIKALVDADWLKNLDQRLKEYQDYADKDS